MAKAEDLKMEVDVNFKGPALPEDGAERRFMPMGEGLEIRLVEEEGKPRRLVGYGAVFNALSLDLGGFREMILPGAFKALLADKPDVRGLFNHDSGFILGRTKAGTMKLKEDNTGLRYEITLPDTQLGRDMAESVRRGDIDGSSFSFKVGPQGERWHENAEGVVVREISSFAKLYDVGPVTYPAYPDATVAARSLDAYREAQKPNFDIRRKRLDLKEKL